jgi:single-strand DNA-binding protein
MAGSLNKTMLIGNLGADPEGRTMQLGGRVVTFTLATTESWKDKETGVRQERTQWHRIAVYNEILGKFAEKHLKKGSKVYVEGTLETRAWRDDKGREQQITEVVLRPFRGELTALDALSGEQAALGDLEGHRAA